MNHHTIALGSHGKEIEVTGGLVHHITQGVHELCRSHTTGLEHLDGIDALLEKAALLFVFRVFLLDGRQARLLGLLLSEFDIQGVNRRAPNHVEQAHDPEAHDEAADESP